VNDDYSVVIANTNANGSTDRTVGHNRLQWGAQLELGSLTEYQPILTGTTLNATQTTAENQPRIVNAGVVETVNSKPQIIFDGVNDSLIVPSWGVVTQPFTRNYVGVRLTASSVNHWINTATGTPDVAEYDNQSATHAMFAATPLPVPLVTGEQAVFTSQYNGVSSSIAKNGAVTTGDAGLNNIEGIRIGGFNGTTAFANIGMQEHSLFTSLLSTTDRQALERNQGNYYSITVI
jgi:hypothetical protein